MATALDRLRRAKHFSTTLKEKMDPQQDAYHAQTINAIISQGKCFDINNIVEYLGQKRPKQDVKNFCLAPPFERFIMFYDEELVNEGLAQKHEATECIFFQADDASVSPDWKEMGFNRDIPYKWLMRCTVVCINTIRRYPTLAGQFCFRLDEEGYVVTHEGEPEGLVIGWFDEEFGDDYALDMAGIKGARAVSQKTERRLKRAIWQSVEVALFALSIANCKNIRTTIIHPNKKKSRKYKQKTGKALLSKRIISIDDNRTSQSSSGPPQGGKKAFHICRGSFARYTKEKPLFGKYVGQVWRPAHAKGSTKKGVVESTYKVNKL